jgi:hypothetical protein
MTDPAKQDKAKPPAGATDPAFKATGPRPAAPKTPGAAAPGKDPASPDGKDPKADAFKVIRTAPTPDADGVGAGPIVAVVVLVILGVAGFVYSRRAGNTGTGTTASTTLGPGTSASTGPAAKPAPQFVIDAINDLETVSSANRALAKALEYRKEYPGAPNLEGKIAELRGKLNQTGPSAAEAQARIGQAQRAIQEQRYDDALELTNALIADSQSPQILAQAYFAAAQADLGKNDMAKATTDLQAAEDNGADKAAVDQLRGMLRH